MSRDSLIRRGSWPSFGGDDAAERFPGRHVHPLKFSDCDRVTRVAARRRASELGIGNAEFFEMEGERMSFPDGSFDVVISRYAYPHFTDASAAFRDAPDGPSESPDARCQTTQRRSVPRNPETIPSGIPSTGCGPASTIGPPSPDPG